jgi:hypothetical protein
MILAPYGQIPGAFPSGVLMSRGTRQQYLGPEDPQWYERGEAGYYYDTALGAPRFGFLSRVKARLKAKLGLGSIPTDFELATGKDYLPVESGWIAAKEGFYTPPWLPPNGYQAGGYPVPVHTPGVSGLRGPEPATTDDVIALMNAHNDRVFALSLVSTTAVAVSALLTVFRTLKLIREDSK